jgi:hypothetical protein
MSFANALNIQRRTLPYYLALTKYGLLRITKDCFEFEANPAAPPIALEMAKAVFTMGASSCTESFVIEPDAGRGTEALHVRCPQRIAPFLFATGQPRQVEGQVTAGTPYLWSETRRFPLRATNQGFLSEMKQQPE